MILINADFNRKQKLGIFADYVPLSVPISIGLLAGYLRAKEIPVKIIDEQIIPINRTVIKKLVREMEKPYIFGFSALTANIGRSYEVAAMIKSLYPDAINIFGGIHPTVLPEEALKNDAADIVVRREGEEILYELYKKIMNKQDYSKVPGISCKKSKKIIHNPDAPLVRDLNTLPLFPYDLFQENNRYNFGFIVSSRGCPYNCIFCSQQCISSRSYRFNNNEKIIAELDLLINKYKQTSISFFDDNFVVNKNRTKQLCELMYKNNFHKKAEFQAQTRGDAIDQEVLHYLKMAGFSVLNFGMETGSERLIRLINKGETVQDNINGVLLSKKAGFRIGATFIMGLPTETDEERRLTYELAVKLPIDYVRFNNATPYPGTVLYEIANKEKRFNPGKNWANLNACGTLVEGPMVKYQMSYVPTTTTEEKLRKDIMRANLFFWLRPSKFIKILIDGEVLGGWFNLPKYWFFKPKEIYKVFTLCLKVGFSLIKNVFGF